MRVEQVYLCTFLLSISIKNGFALDPIGMDLWWQPLAHLNVANIHIPGIKNTKERWTKKHIPSTQYSLSAKFSKTLWKATCIPRLILQRDRAHLNDFVAVIFFFLNYLANFKDFYPTLPHPLIFLPLDRNNTLPLENHDLVAANLQQGMLEMISKFCLWFNSSSFTVLFKLFLKIF